MTLRGCLQLLQASLYPSGMIAITLMPSERGNRSPSEHQQNLNARMRVFYKASKWVVCDRSFQN